MILRRSPVFKYHVDVKSKKNEKNEKIEKNEKNLGPGYLKDLEMSLKGKVLGFKTPDPIFLKEKKFCKFEKDAEKMKFVPGVGSYKNVENAFKRFVDRKLRSPVVLKERLVRSTERAGKDKMWIPGPGSYNLFRF